MRSIAEIRAFLFREPKAITVQRKTNKEAVPFLTFPDAKQDFSDGVYGRDGFDLANAFVQKVVQTGDLLQIVTEDLSDPKRVKNEVRNVIYLEPESALLGKDGMHRLWEEHVRAGIDLPSITTQGAIIYWKKIGSASPDELKRIIEAVEPLFDSKGSRIPRKLSPKPLL